MFIKPGRRGKGKRGDRREEKGGGTEESGGNCGKRRKGYVERM